VLVADPLSRFAEEPDAEIPEPAPPAQRFVRPRFTLSLSPAGVARVSRVRTTEVELDDTVYETRVLLRTHGAKQGTWLVGPTCRPVGLAALLAARGFLPAARPLFEPRFTVMALARPPVEGPPAPSVEVRLVADLDEYVSAVRAGLEAAGQPGVHIAAMVAAAPAAWEHDASVARLTHVAHVDGQLAGFGFVRPGPPAVLLGGGAVVGAFRGRGAYRALVVSRWRAAARMGTPALAVHAGAMSRPVLERLGFEPVCSLDVLVDTT
jgi:hypothetical protein